MFVLYTLEIKSFQAPTGCMECPCYPHLTLNDYRTTLTETESYHFACQFKIQTIQFQYVKRIM